MKPSNEEMLKDHLPYRLTLLDGFSWACKIIESKRFKSKLSISFNGTVIPFPNMIPLTNALSESGIVHCRGLMEFLGIKRKDNKLEPIKKKKLKKDFNITNLSLGSLKAKDVKEAQICHDPEQIEQACLHILKSASKAVAHFTDQEARALSYPGSLCAQTIMWLVENRVYKALNRKVPNYRIWTNQGIT